MRKVVYCLSEKQGSTLIEAIVAVALLGIAVVALFLAFGGSSDYGETSTEYLMANGLAQKQVELLKTKDKAFWDAAALTTSAWHIFDSYQETLSGSSAVFLVTYKAKTVVYDSSTYIIVNCNVSWSSHGKTGASSSHQMQIETEIPYPSV